MESETKKITINIIANAVWGPEGMSGGDRIFIESARRWAKLGYEINIFGWEDTLDLCKANNLAGVNYFLWPAKKYQRLGFIPLYLIRTIKGCLAAWRQVDTSNRNIVYSASDFWPDSLPGLIMGKKLKTRWVGSLYLFAPNPFKGFSTQKGLRLPELTELFYFISQKPIIWLLKKYASLIFVTYDLDRERFIKMGVHPDKVKAIYGGVDLSVASSLKTPKNKKYHGIFIGRFHPQKGLPELIKIWHHICVVKKNARLAIVGLGDSDKEQNLKEIIKEYNLEENVDLLGPKDGREKYEILKTTKVYLCTNLYDSGGMATIEAMAAGLPVVSFDIPAVRSLITKGTIRVPFRDTQKFAQAVIELMQDKNLYKNIKEEALSLAKEWDWEVRAKRILEFILAN